MIVINIKITESWCNFQMKFPRRRMIAVILITALIFVVVKTWVDNQ
jgi:hypothetical protein